MLLSSASIFLSAWSKEVGRCVDGSLSSFLLSLLHDAGSRPAADISRNVMLYLWCQRASDISYRLKQREINGADWWGSSAYEVLIFYDRTL